MKTSELLSLRLHHQRITAARSREPQEVVSTLLAMQAQEYAMAKWAIGLRMKGPIEDPDVERAFNAGEILRTHVLRPTWHFVAPADIRWLVALTAPRVKAASAYIYRQLELDARLFARSDALLARALEGGQYLTRATLQTILAKSGIKADGPRLGALVMHAELEGLLCSGPREGRQFTYALLELRAPKSRALARDAALVELSERYFGTRGPASAQDFAAWSGLTLKDARTGLEALGRKFERTILDGREYVFLPARATPARGQAFLMPDYDEYGMSYKDRTALFPSDRPGTLAFNRMIIVDGRIAGSWRRTMSRSSVSVETDLAGKLTRAQREAVAAAIARFTRFLGRARPE